MTIKAPLSVITTAVISILSTQTAFAEETTNDDQNSNVIKIIGSKSAAKDIPGSAHVVTEADLQEMKYTDATRALQRVPGVYIQQEDGLGLRPNIGIRGSGTERSGRVTLMEDGVLIAPAPYAASSAYYFPTFDRMTGIEVLKGPAAIKYGPFTTGGAINFISRQIPEDAQGQLNLELGQDGQQRVAGFYGQSMDNFGFLIEANQHQYDGFKQIDRSGGDTGFDKDDYLVKLRFNSDADAAIYQQFDLKIQHSTEDSDQTYLGLTEVDYAANPYRQYGLSELDNFEGEHDQIMATYSIDFSDEFGADLTLYRNETFRNWFKTEGIHIGGSATGSRSSWASVVNSINTGGTNAAYLQSILDGADTNATDQIEIRSNRREYISEGVQLNFEWSFTTGSAEHNLQFGIRSHEDEEDRLQRNSFYIQQGGALALDDIGILGNAGNRLQTAEATSIYVMDTIELGNWILTPGLRHEDIDLSRTRWNRSGPGRTNADFRDSRDNSVSEVLPGFGALYKLSNDTSLLFGVNKGFAPPGNDTGDQPEESWNYEAGIRFGLDNLTGEFIVFINDYDNLLGECSNANSGCDSNNDGDKENGGKAKVQGFEFTLGGDLATNWPMRFSYTYTDSEFESSFDSDVWGPVENGDSIPYIPENIAQLAIGYDQQTWNLFATAVAVSGVCTKAACEQFQQTDSLFMVDLSGEYQLNEQTSIYAVIDNIFEEDAIAAREPYGARSVKARTAKIGIRFNF